MTAIALGPNLVSLSPQSHCICSETVVATLEASRTDRTPRIPTRVTGVGPYSMPMANPSISRSESSFWQILKDDLRPPAHSKLLMTLSRSSVSVLVPSASKAWMQSPIKPHLAATKVPLNDILELCSDNVQRTNCVTDAAGLDRAINVARVP